MNHIFVKCDVCDKKYRLTSKQNYDLEKAEFLIYCNKCADKLGINKFNVMEKSIKIYKM